jgi:aspartate racemase
VVLPDARGQQEVMRLIYQGVKAGKADYDTAPLRRVLDKMLSRGAQALILGCTELPLIFAQYEGLSPYPAIDPTAILAAAAIREAGIRTGGKE